VDARQRYNQRRLGFYSLLTLDNAVGLSKFKSDISLQRLF